MTTTTNDPGAQGGEGEGAASTGADGSLFDGVQPAAAAAASGEGGEGATAAATQGADTDWLPEKFRVVKDDGSLDEGASARKLADSYRALESHKGPLLEVPASPADYRIAAPVDAEGNPVEGFDIEGFTGDPLFKDIAGRAHAKGIPNAHLEFFVHEYLGIAPQILAADQQLTLEEARAELSSLWPDDAAFKQNMAGVVKAINGFGGEAEDVPGSRSRLMSKYGRDPDFVAFAAAVAGEMKEDRVPVNGGLPGEVDIESLQKSEAYWNAGHPDHGRIKAQVDAHYTRKFGASRKR